MKMPGIEQNDRAMKLDLERIVFIGRTYDEYISMFDLNIEDLQGKRILDCPSGACSFTAAAVRQGIDVMACDIAYEYAADDLQRKGIQDVAHAMEQMAQAAEQYEWGFFGDIDGLRAHRLQALRDCSVHRREEPHRYVHATLPSLPFEDGEFDVVLSAHFLFMYGDRLDEAFHRNTLVELLRVAKEEVRIFPLIDLAWKRPPQVDIVIEQAKHLGCEVQERTVPYEFMRGGNTMLYIKKK